MHSNFIISEIKEVFFQVIVYVEILLNLFLDKLTMSSLKSSGMPPGLNCCSSVVYSLNAWLRRPGFLYLIRFTSDSFFSLVTL